MEKMLESVVEKNRSWFDGMHTIRHRWACCFSRGIFTACLLATSRSKVTNKVLKNAVHRTITLTSFVKQYDVIVDNWRSTERTEDTWGMWEPGQLINNSGLHNKAARVFTRTIFKQFEHDYANCVTMIIDLKSAIYLANNQIQYTVRDKVYSHTLRKVVFHADSNYDTYDCGKWETEGLICRHILKVLIINNATEFPDCMIYHRWTKRAKDLQSLTLQLGVDPASSILSRMTFANEFMRHMSELVSTAMQYEPLRLKHVSE